MSSCIWSPLLSYRGSVISACIGLRGLLGVNQDEFFSSHSFMHYSNKSYETEWSFLNHKKGNKNLRLKDTCTFVIEKLRIKRTGSESGLCRGRLIKTHKDSEVEARPTKEHNHIRIS